MDSQTQAAFPPFCPFSPAIRRPLRWLAVLIDRLPARAYTRGLATKAYRLALQRPLKHMSPAGPRFFLSEPEPGTGIRRIHWNGRCLGVCPPLDGIRNTQHGACFLVGTGPSLKDVDLGLLKQYRTFGVNGAITNFKAAGFAPNYYAIADHEFFETRFPMVRDAVEAGCKCFFSFSGLSRMCEFGPDLLGKTDMYVIDAVNRHYGRPRLGDDELQTRFANDTDLVFGECRDLDATKVGFSRNLGKGVFCPGTILYWALQIAYHIGYRRIFILGMDLNYQGPNPRSYAEPGRAQPSSIPRIYEESILPSFQLVAGLCQREDLKVYNLSPTSRLPESVIPRLTLEQAIALAG
jgi:KDO transferase-3